MTTTIEILIIIIILFFILTLYLLFQNGKCYSENKDLFNKYEELLNSALIISEVLLKYKEFYEIVIKNVNEYYEEIKKIEKEDNKEESI